MVNPITISLVDGISAGLAGISDSVNGVGAGFVKLNAGVELFTKAVGFAVDVAKGLANAITPAADFEDALAKVQAQSGATAEELEGLKTAAETATETTRFTALEAAEALRVMAEDGISAKDSMEQVGTVLAYAQANALGASAAAAGLGGVLDGFGEPAAAIGQLADSLTSVARAAGTSTKSLQDGLAGVGAQAQAADVGIGDAAAALGVFASAGKDGTAGAALLGKLITELNDPAKKAGAAIQGLGLNTSDFAGLVRNLRGDTDAAASVMESLSSRGRLALGILLNDGGASLDGMLDKYKNFAGASQAAADVVGDTFNAALDKLQNAFEQTKRTLLAPLLEPLTAEIQEAAKEIFAFSKTAEFDALSQSIKGFVIGSVAQIKEFIAEFDFKAATEGVTQFVSDVKAGFEEFNGYINSAKVAAETIKGIYSGLGIGLNATQAALNVVQQGTQGSAAIISDAVSGIGKAFGANTESIDDFTRSMIDASYASEEASGKNIAELVAQFDYLVGNTEAAAAALDTATVAATATAVAASELSTKLSEASESGGNILKLSDVFTQISLDANRSSTDIADALGKAFEGQKTIADAENLRGQLKVVFNDLGLNVDNVDAAFDKFKDNLANPDAAKNFSDAMTGVSDALGALITNTEGAQEKFNAALSKLFQGATAEEARALQEQVSAAMFDMGASVETVDKAFAAFNKSLEKAADSKAVADLSKAFDELGVKSQAELNRAAQNAEANFDKIVEGSRNAVGGMADIRAAFIAYAKTQLDTVKNSDEFAKAQTIAALEGKAAAAGLGESLQDLGVVAKESAGKVTDGIRAIVPAANEAASSVDGVASALDGAADGADNLASSSANLADGFGRVGSTARGVAVDLGQVSSEFSRMIASSGLFDVERTNRLTRGLSEERQRAAERIKQINDEANALDPLQQKYDSLRRQFRYIGEDQLKAIADAEERLDRLRNTNDQAQKEANNERSSLAPIKLEISNKQTDGTPINLSPEQLSVLSTNIMNEIARRRLS